MAIRFDEWGKVHAIAEGEPPAVGVADLRDGVLADVLRAVVELEHRVVRLEEALRPHTTGGPAAAGPC